MVRGESPYGWVNGRGDSRLAVAGFVFPSASSCFGLKILFRFPQVCTQRSWKRPYGVGLLVAGLDETGPHLYQNCPSGNYFEFMAFAIGSRSQAAKTYLERKFETFMECSKDELVRHGLHAVKESLQDEELSSASCSVAIVGIGEPFVILDGKTLQAYIDSLEGGKDDQAAKVEEEEQSRSAAIDTSGGEGVGVGGEGEGPTDMET